ncbi:YTH domain-containing family protein 1 [Ananas comosus]|uniref:YTH domain-containing family protein n=1 Tax=Ananas comosus TaxID=4615 RepID=A0A199UKW0_ANACO|nr:YTH domain-containing family protein 1 [Ananas comosus]
MATPQQAPDQADVKGSAEPLSIDSNQKAVDAASSQEQPLSDQDEQTRTSDASHEANTIDLSRDSQIKIGSHSEGGEHSSVVQLPNVSASQVQTVLYAGYANPAGEWEDYPHYLSVEGLEIGSAGMYNENHSLLFHTGFGFSPQMPYGPYSPVTTPLPSISGDGQLYSPQHFPFTAPYYQQPPGMPYMNPPSPMSQADPMMPVDPQGAFLTDALSSSSLLFGPRPGYHLSYGSFGRDWSKPSDGSGSVTTLPSPAASPQPIGAPGSFGQSTIPAASGMASQHQKSLYGFGSSNSSYERGYSHSGLYQHVAKPRPTATRPKKQAAEQDSLPEIKGQAITGVNEELYNSPDFPTEYTNASEDNVHKSIKYGVWASTANGNKKLDSAFHEAKEREDPYPFFCFSRGQFCGVAEMVGPVDSRRAWTIGSKTSGPASSRQVHIVKDVRIICSVYHSSRIMRISCNNSRDTQENHEAEMSILDDFEFYEQREKAMQENKALLLQQQQQHQQQQISANSVAGHGDRISHITKSFAQVVRLEEANSRGQLADKSASLNTSASAATPKKQEANAAAPKKAVREEAPQKLIFFINAFLSSS